LQDGLRSTGEPLQAGMDANVNCAALAPKIAAAGLRFVARYYSSSSSKALTATEAQALSAAGLSIVTVFQDFNNSLKYFSAMIGTKQARKALAMATAIGQPAGSAIYFASDFDPSPADVRGPVMEYFHAVHDELSASAYKMGVYGSGLTCRLIRDAGFAKWTWLAQSTGFREYKAFMPQADLVQAAPARDLIPKRLNIDDDIAQSADFGAFQVA